MKKPGMLLVQFFTLILLSFQIPGHGGIQKSEKPAPSTDLEFASGTSALRIPFEFVGNHIYLRAHVNESDPLWLLLDTGATASYFDARQATVLGLGVPGESIKVALSFSGLKLHNQIFTVQPLTFGIYDGHAVDALLGYDFISRFAIEIDYVSKTINLHDPPNYQYSGSGEVLKLLMLEDDSGAKVPLVRARILQPKRDPVEGKFIADTAVRSAMNFNSPFVEKNRLLQATEKTIEAPLGGGAIVRESTQPIGRVLKIELGRFTLKDCLAVFFQEKAGILASPEFDGVIGGEVLRRFTVVFDYSREQLILEPNRYFSEPYEYDRSGLHLSAEGADFKIFKVRQLIQNSPATEAGLREGDVISAIDGIPASKLSLEEIRQMFMKEGQVYRIDVKRGDKDLQLQIKLRKLI